MWNIKMLYPFRLNFFSVVSPSLLPSIIRAIIFFSFTFWVEIASWKVFKFTAKRALIFVPLSTLVLAVMIWNHIGYFLDDLIFPRWRDQKIERPLFIVGNARSGTTWLHRLITLDDSFFTTMKTWEIIFASSVTWRKLFGRIFDLDKRWLNGRICSLLLRLEAYCFGGNSLHRVGLFEAEEDEWIMLHIFTSQLIMLMFPLGGFLLNSLVYFDLEKDDTELPGDIRIMIMTFYRDCVKRHLFARQRRLVFVSKNPAFTMRIRTLYHLFPDARIVCLVRDPIQSVPSMISYISHSWAFFASPVLRYPQFETLLQFCKYHYSFPQDHLSGREEHLWAFVGYANLKSDLASTLVELLIRLRYISSREDAQSNSLWLKFEGLLQKEQRLAASFSSKHRHSVEECCGISLQKFQLEFRSVYIAYRVFFPEPTS